MYNAPAVYVPTPPEGNGLTLPTVLSLLAHGLVIGILIYTYHNTEVETAGSIETVMVSPEQLAEMQGQILANRAAAANAMQTTNHENAVSGSIQSDGTDGFDSNISTQAPSQPSSQRVPVTTRPDTSRPDTANQSMLMSDEQRQRLLEQNQEYERNMAKWAAQLDESVTKRHEPIQQEKRQQLIEEQRRLEELRHKQNNPPKITRPTPTDRNLKIDTGSASNARKTFSLGDDGQPTSSGTMSGQSSGGSPARSSGDFKSAIISKIQSKTDTPFETQGLSTSLSLKLDSKGNVKFAKASGPNAIVNQAVEKAAHAASPLPIDLDNPASFANLTINININ